MTTPRLGARTNAVPSPAALRTRDRIGSARVGVAAPTPANDYTGARAQQRAVGGGVKRAIDVAIAAVLLLFLAPLLLLIAVAVRLGSKGPALFRQTRIGLFGRPFSILKFRTMRVMENGADVVQAKADDPRVTRLGALLRRTSLDELPQLINVLRGDMSLVGPRPHAIAHDEHYRRLIPTYTARWRARPGMTGLAQVTGWRGPTPQLSDMEGRVDQDVRYVESWTPRIDLAIALRTIKVVWTGDAAV